MRRPKPLKGLVKGKEAVDFGGFISPIGFANFKNARKPEEIERKN